MTCDRKKQSIKRICEFVFYDHAVCVGGISWFLNFLVFSFFFCFFCANRVKVRPSSLWSSRDNLGEDENKLLSLISNFEHIWANNNYKIILVSIVLKNLIVGGEKNPRRSYTRNNDKGSIFKVIYLLARKLILTVMLLIVLVKYQYNNRA